MDASGIAIVAARKRRRRRRASNSGKRSSIATWTATCGTSALCSIKAGTCSSFGNARRGTGPACESAFRGRSRRRALACPRDRPVAPNRAMEFSTKLHSNVGVHRRLRRAEWKAAFRALHPEAASPLSCPTRPAVGCPHAPTFCPPVQLAAHTLGYNCRGRHMTRRSPSHREPASKSRSISTRS